MKKYLIIPSSSDLNRGDQALVWQTVEIAKDAGYSGEYYMLASEYHRTSQSQQEGLNILKPILKHPGRKTKDSENIEYNLKIILSWGIVAFFDLIFSLLLLFKPTRTLIKPLMSSDNKKALSVFENCDAVFVKGGGFIHSSGKITDSYTVYYQVFHIFLAQSFNKKVYVMPNSFGPFKGLGVEKLVRKALNNCELVTVRESISHEMLDNIHVDSKIYPDLGFGLTKNTHLKTNLSDIREKHPGKKLVAFTARPYRFPNVDNSEQRYQNYITGMVELSIWLYENNYFPIFVNHTLSENTHESDISAIKEITSMLNENTFDIISNDDFDARDLKAIYSEMDFVIGTRFHSVIFAMSENIPSIAITYGGNKGQGIMKDLGLQNYAIKMSEFNSKEVISKIQELTINELRVREILKNEKENILTQYNDLSRKISKV